MARARAWWEQDRKLGRPGVEVPDALARKYPKGSTTMIDTHVLRIAAGTVASPLDALAASPGGPQK